MKPSRVLSARLLSLALGLALGAGSIAGEREQQLEHMLRHDCGSCHGMRLAGGLGPALTEAALRDKSDRLLRDTILYGRSGTPMPPFAALLSPEDVEWLVARLRGSRD